MKILNKEIYLEQIENNKQIKSGFIKYFDHFKVQLKKKKGKQCLYK